MDWDQLIGMEMDWAVEQRRQVKVDGEFRMRVRVVMPHDEIFQTPFIWRSEDEKRVVMRALSEVCRRVAAQAAVITSDARFLDTPAFSKYFGIPEPTLDTYDQWNKRRAEIMKGYGYYMGNLPPETWHDTLMVAVKGPRVERMAARNYEVLGDSIEFKPMDLRAAGKTTVGMLPAWWQ